MWDKADRRKYSRVEYPCLITLHKNISPPPLVILTHTRNISVGGVRVIIEKRIEPQTAVDLELDLKDTLPNIISAGKIAWVRQIPSPQGGRAISYDTGLQFTALQDKDRRRINNIVHNFRGRIAH